MKQVQKILFPIDFASHFESLLPWVKTFAEKFGATVYVLFVAQDLSSFATFYVPHGNIQSFQQEAMDAARKKMAAEAQEMFKGIAKLETRVELGSPAEKILEVAKKEKIDLIIMGAHGRKGLERAIFGSVADKVVQSAPCPVMTIHP
ncbi:MAG: universal stress protein [Syntrophobacterales bacterium]|jgi:nucleotide-binding universal stress UspA family protein|nr:universal stress protein [Syntrophobacterales bacterium]